MVGDPTGYAGPHPDIRQLVCDILNQVRAFSRDSEPKPVVALENITVRCQCTWYGIGEGGDGADRANYSVAIIEVDSGDRVASFMLEAIQPADGQEWKRYAMPGGIRADKPEGLMIFLGALMSVGGIARSDRSASLRVEYAGGSSFESPFVDRYAIVLTPTISPAYPTEAATFSWVDRNGDVIESTWIGAGNTGGSAGSRRQS